MRLNIFAWLLLLLDCASAHAGTAFTYQGELYNSSVPVNANYDFRFILYSADVGGMQAGDVSESINVPVTQGVFTVVVDFGNGISGGSSQYIEISARPTGAGAYAVMSPRQLLTGAPQALSLALPYSDDVTSGDAALSINNFGDGSAASFASGTTFASVYVANSGTGSAMRADTASNGTGSAVLGYNYGVQRYGGEFEAINPLNTRAGVYARASGVGQAIDAEINSPNSTGDALYARTTSTQSGSFAGYFSGPVLVQCPSAQCNTPLALQVLGTMSKSAGTFRIDHPLDPENKYLSHSFVESPDMKNVYDGVAILDRRGEATVTLPDWFQALNRDFRYQLTAMGAAAPGLHVREEMRDNQFRIGGGLPGGKVSWQLTGIRQDAYAQRYPTPVEEDKPPHERGKYLIPELYGKSKAHGVAGADEPPIKEFVPMPE